MIFQHLCTPKSPGRNWHFTDVRDTSKDMVIPGDFFLLQVLMVCTTVVAQAVAQLFSAELVHQTDETGVKRETG